MTIFLLKFAFSSKPFQNVLACEKLMTYFNTESTSKPMNLEKAANDDGDELRIRRTVAVVSTADAVVIIIGICSSPSGGGFKKNLILAVTELAHELVGNC